MNLIDVSLLDIRRTLLGLRRIEGVGGRRDLVNLLDLELLYIEKEIKRRVGVNVARIVKEGHTQ